jgi:sugar/nucleoside kinase (ribokinase family)
MVKGSTHRCVVVGGSVLDIVYQAVDPTSTPKSMIFTSTPSRLVRRSPGGVGRNLAAAISALGVFDVTFFTVVGEDALPIQKVCGPVEDKFRQEAIILPNQATARYTALLAGDGDLVAAAANMEIFDTLQPETFLKNPDFVAAVRGASALVLEGNLPEKVIDAVTKWATSPAEQKHRKRILSSWARHDADPSASDSGVSVERQKPPPPFRIYFDPVSTTKATRGVSSLHRFFAVKPNEHEIHTLLNGLSVGGGKDIECTATECGKKTSGNSGGKPSGPTSVEEHGHPDLIEYAATRISSEGGCPLVLATRGPEGVTIAYTRPNRQNLSDPTSSASATQRSASAPHDTLTFTMNALPLPKSSLMKVTGAGDTFLASFLSFVHLADQRFGSYLTDTNDWGHVPNKDLLRAAATFALIGARWALVSKEPIPEEALRRLAAGVDWSDFQTIDRSLQSLAAEEPRPARTAGSKAKL